MSEVFDFFYSRIFSILPIRNSYTILSQSFQWIKVITFLFTYYMIL